MGNKSLALEEEDEEEEEGEEGEEGTWSVELLLGVWCAERSGQKGSAAIRIMKAC